MTTITIPQLEMAMTEGTLSEWLVQDGAKVNEGDLIYLLETGKATQEIAAPAAGTLKQIGQTGVAYPVGTVIGEIA
ncbi:MAG TPA: lipoyl domain-containing protein [Steroidobacteraceae bacterium]|nr:lipoyl domain-containing protein [Steroidobacteraceae bacterium]